MDILAKWIGEQSNLIGSFQIVLDLVLVLVLLVAITYGRRGKAVPETGDLIESFEKVIEETRAISREFNSNLKERQALIQQILTRLDQRVAEAQKLCAQLENLKRETFDARAVPASQAAPSSGSEQQKVLLLAKKGLDAEAIAKRLQKPLGEVELILNLQRLSSTR